MKYSQYNSPVGKITLASNGKNLTGLWIEGQKHFPIDIKKSNSINSDAQEPLKCNDDEVFFLAKRWLDDYFDGKNPTICDLPLEPKGNSEFSECVWRLLRDIPYGTVVSYGDISTKLTHVLNRDKVWSRAVGGAVGRNPISIIIPCHRVVGKRGCLTGYAAGIETKIKLLKHEGIDISKFTFPK